MRRTKLQTTMAVLMTAVLLGGCGEEPYALTEQEEELIVNYSAHIVTKYNTYQKEGLSYVWEEESEETESGPTDETEAENSSQADLETGTQAPVPDDIEENSDTMMYTQATLAELFGEPDVEINYVGARLANSYMESVYYAQYPDPGKQYLVLGIDITNIGEEPAALDYLNDTIEFQVNLNHEVTSSAEITVLTDDFSTFEGTIEAGETKETVLLFQVPAEVSSIESVELIVIGDTNYQIILENE